jgi:Domain of unknown function (DUF1707)
MPDGGRPDLRVSDAERDVVAAELGEHFQVGRLNQDEFDERLTAALAAKTRGDLSALLTDLPQRDAVQVARPAQPAPSPARYLPLIVPLLFAVMVASGLSHGGPHGAHHGALPLLWLWWAVPAAIIWMRRRHAAEAGGPGDEGRGGPPR